ncbi:hypothetical protein N8Z80_02445 [Litorivicinus sp.]|nr:hypothetical protein [Litorivicinus sp.]MDC1239879.1 hypothetical protein [Litorivicinus sp.]
MKNSFIIAEMACAHKYDIGLARNVIDGASACHCSAARADTTSLRPGSPAEHLDRCHTDNPD